MVKIKGSRDYLVALESVAMTDIVLNMFIFFFISFSLIYTFNPEKLSKIDVRLPKASTAVSLKGSDRIVLAITKEGQYYIDDEKVGPALLKSEIGRRIKENPSCGIILKVDGTAKFDAVVKALDVVNALNVQKVSIASVKKE